MTKFVKIGGDVINLEAVSHVSFLENQSGISDRIIIQVANAEVVVDSAIGGKPRMLAIREKLLSTLEPEIWDNSMTEEQTALASSLPPLSRAA